MPLPVRALLALALLVAAGCDSSDLDTSRSQAEADLSLELGETASVDGLAITFESVAEDSRCPEGSVCVWGGQARVALRIAGTVDTLLATDPELAPNAVAERGEVLVRAVSLFPYPGSKAAQRGETPVVFLQTERVEE